MSQKKQSKQLFPGGKRDGEKKEREREYGKGDGD